MKRLMLMLIMSALAAGFSTRIDAAEKKEKLMVYTSMKESMFGKLKDAFVKKYPNVTFDYYSTGAGKLMAKIATERQAGKIAADIIWTSEIPDFYKMKSEGILAKYVSPEVKNIKSTMIDPDGYFTPARLGTLGLAYNTKKVKQPPKSWLDVLDKRFHGGLGIANPALSGTAMVSVAMIVGNLGWNYIEKIKANDSIMGQGSGQVVDDTASGDLMLCLGVDYIVIDKMKQGADLGFVYPKEMLVIPSPIAIFKDTQNLDAAKKFIDFVLSKEAQTIVAESGTIPVRPDVPVIKGYGLVSPDEAVKRSMKIDYQKMIVEKESIIQKFSTIMRAKK
jgi:iron(III) transport system substrate-binding protein